MRTMLTLLVIALPAFYQEALKPDSLDPSQENQWPQYVAIMAELSPFVDEAKANDRAIRREGNEWAGYGFASYYVTPAIGLREHHAVERARLAGVLDEWTRRGVFEYTEALAGLPRAVPPQRAIDAPPEYSLTLVRELARVQLARMHLAAQRSDDEVRIRALHEILAMYRLHAWHDSLLGWLVAESGARDACAELLRTQLIHPMPSDTALAQADAVIAHETLDRWIAPDGLLELVRSDLLGIIDHVYTDDGQGGGTFRPEAYDELLRGGPRRISLENVETPFAPRGRAVEWSGRFLMLLSEMLAARGEGYIAAKQAALRHIEDADPSLPIAGDLGPAYVFTARNARRWEVMVAGTRVVLAIERYRLTREGEPPASLADLGALLPVALRTDPLSGEPWKYTAEAMQTDEFQQPLLPGALAWPYTLKAQPLNGKEPALGYAREATEGLLITPPIQGPEFDPVPSPVEDH
ncbi:MAG: hypothetical protein RIB58_07225 [Phycisphaerales bacterium]